MGETLAFLNVRAIFSKPGIALEYLPACCQCLALYRSLLGSGAWSRFEGDVHMQKIALGLFAYLLVLLGIEPRASCVQGNQSFYC